MNATTCPFCGLATTEPHNSQKSCIEALHGEIARMRNVLESVQTPADRNGGERSGTPQAELEAEDESEPELA